MTKTHSAMTDELRRAAGAVSGAGLSDAFGHVSIRTRDGLRITPPIPLSEAALGGDPIDLRIDDGDLPPGAPLEGWLHVAIAASHSSVGAVVRAQPPAIAALASLGRDLPILSGHAAMLHGVHLHRSSLLVRDRASAEKIVADAGEAKAIVLRGNGAITLGSTLAEAVARMWVLERSARLALDAWAAGDPEPLPVEESLWWEGRADELLPRIYRYLVRMEGNNHD